MIYYTTNGIIGSSRLMYEKYREIDPGLPERLGGNLKTLESVCGSSFSSLRKKDLSQAAVNCGALITEGNKLAIKYFNNRVIVDPEAGKLYYSEGQEEVDIFSSTIILHYILTADGQPLTGQWVSYRELPHGMFYFRTIPGVMELLLEKFGHSFRLLAKKAQEYGGSLSSDFKNGVILYPFPYFPVLIILEEESEEFNADVRALFDRSASHYMNTDIIKVLLVNIVRILTR